MKKATVFILCFVVVVAQTSTFSATNYVYDDSKEDYVVVDQFPDDLYFDDHLRLTQYGNPDLDGNNIISDDEVKLLPGNSALNYFFMETFYTRVPAEESITGDDVCIYVSDKDYTGFLGRANNHREKLGLNDMKYSQDLEDGAMLRAGQYLDEYYRGNGMLEPTVEEEYDVYESFTNRFANKIYTPYAAYNDFLADSKYLPDDYEPTDGIIEESNGGYTGFYTRMVNPDVKYAAQGLGSTDNKCDGTIERTLFVQEYATDKNDRFPGLYKTMEKVREGVPGDYYYDIQERLVEDGTKDYVSYFEEDTEEEKEPVVKKEGVEWTTNSN